jgi:hypothetical protein
MRNFCYNTDTWGLPNKILNYKLKIEISIPNFIKSNGKFTKTPQESIDYALNEMFPNDDISAETPLQKTIREEIEAPLTITSDDIPFTETEITQIINNLKPKKTPGWDQLNNQIIKKFIKNRKYVTDLAKRQIENKGFLMIVSLEITGAFDNASWPQILVQLKRNYCAKNLFYLFKSYLIDRKAILQIGHIIAYTLLSKSCPQGSAFRPELWDILYDELLEIPTQSDNDIIGFCDDTLALIWGKDISTIEETANKLLQDIYNWGQKVKLDFNPLKSWAVLMTRKRKYNFPNIL